MVVTDPPVDGNTADADFWKCPRSKAVKRVQAFELLLSSEGSCYQIRAVMDPRERSKVKAMCKKAQRLVKKAKDGEDAEAVCQSASELNYYIISNLQGKGNVDLVASLLGKAKGKIADDDDEANEIMLSLSKTDRLEGRREFVQLINEALNGMLECFEL